jgi:hypothetical protein
VPEPEVVGVRVRLRVAVDVPVTAGDTLSETPLVCVAVALIVRLLLQLCETLGVSETDDVALAVWLALVVAELLGLVV